MSANIVIEDSQTVSPHLGGRLGTVFSRFASMCAACVSIQVLAIVFAGYHPLIELASHFAVHGLCVLLVVLPLLVYFRRWRMSMVAILSLVYLLLLVQPWNLYLREPAAPSIEQKHSIEVLSWNLLAVNKSYAEIESLIRDADADVLVLIETRPGLFEDLPFVLATYPWSQQYLSWNGSGICVFSRISGTTFEFNDFGCKQMPAIVMSIPDSVRDPSKQRSRAGIDSQGTAAKLIALHTLSPIPVNRTYGRDLQLATLASWAAAEKLPVCVCGDFNTTPWTRSFQKLQSAGLIDSRQGVGNCPSWPDRLGGLGLPIDHVLFKGACTVTERKVLERAAGSDHRPVMFRLHF